MGYLWLHRLQWCSGAVVPLLPLLALSQPVLMLLLLVLLLPLLTIS
jgi:hypothetical protein